MSNLGAPTVSDSVIRHLERRAARLVLLVETASQSSPEREIREGGAQLVERVIEMTQELLELKDAGDDSLAEVADVFHRRLYIAEKKIEAWNIPISVLKKIDKKPAEPSARAPRRRAPRKQTAQAA